MSQQARSEIRSFIESKFPNMTFTDEQDIFALGFVNSLFAMELVMFVEKAFGVRLPNEELQLDNFRTVASMGDLVQRRSAAAQ